MELAKLLLLANRHDHHAQAKLSLQYYLGNEVPTDRSKARMWLQKAALDATAIESVFNLNVVRNHAEACFDLYQCLSANTPSAHPYLVSSANQGHLLAQKTLALLVSDEALVTAVGLAVSDKQAIHWLEQPDFHGQEDVHKALFTLYSRSKISDGYEAEKAVYHAQCVAHTGDPEVTYALGVHNKQLPVSAQNTSAAVQWLYLSACLPSPVEACAKSDLNSLRIKDIDGAFEQGVQAAHAWLELHARDSAFFNQHEQLFDPINGDALAFVISKQQIMSGKAGPNVIDNPKTPQAEMINRWHRYCGGDKTVSSSHFFCFFYDDPPLTEVQLKDIFRYYDCRDELIARLNVVKAILFARDGYTLSQKQIEDTIKQDLRFRISSLDRFHRVKFLSIEYIDAVEFKHIESTDEFKKLQEQTELAMSTLDATLDKVKSSAHLFPGYYGLGEALYGLSRDYRLQHYFLAALSKRNADFGPFLLLCKASVEYCVDEDTVYWVNR